MSKVSKMIRSQVLIATLLWALLAAADPSAAQDPSAVTTPAEATTNTPSLVRDPFWPMGYWPPPRQRDADSATDQTPARIRLIARWPRLELKGIFRQADGRCLALIDGVGMVEEGTVVTLPRDGLIYRWKINAVSPQGVSHVKLDARSATGE